MTLTFCFGLCVVAIVSVLLEELTPQPIDPTTGHVPLRRLTGKPQGLVVVNAPHKSNKANPDLYLRCFEQSRPCLFAKKSIYLPQITCN